MDHIKVLAVEDNLLDRVLLQEYLKEAQDMSFEFGFADRLQEAQGLLRSHQFDVIILDLGLPDSQGIETFYKVSELETKLPIVILSGNNNEEIAQQAVKDGAHDYIVKGKFDAKSLIRSIRYAIRRQRTRLKIQGQTSQDISHIISNKTPVFVDPRPKKEEPRFESSLREEYTALVQDLQSNSLQKNPRIIEHIKKLALKLYKTQKKPEELIAYSNSQNIFDKDSEIISLINADLCSEMISLVFFEPNTKKDSNV